MSLIAWVLKSVYQLAVLSVARTVNEHEAGVDPDSSSAHS
jgi:hypothetical protein